jgi:hypothetical protein
LFVLAVVVFMIVEVCGFVVIAVVVGGVVVADGCVCGVVVVVAVVVVLVRARVSDEDEVEFDDDAEGDIYVLFMRVSNSLSTNGFV